VRCAENGDRQAPAVALQQRDLVRDGRAPTALEADAKATALRGVGDSPALPGHDRGEQPARVGTMFGGDQPVDAQEEARLIGGIDARLEQVRADREAPRPGGRREAPQRAGAKLVPQRDGRRTVCATSGAGRGST
jgi:hypothetical protein